MKEKLADAMQILGCAHLDSIPYRRIDGKYFPSDEQKAMYSIAERIVREALEELVMIQGESPESTSRKSTRVVVMNNPEL